MLEMIKFLVSIISMFLWLLPCLTHADVVCLKNGNHVEGIITREEGDTIELKFYVGAKITFSREEIERIERASSEENKELEERWQVEEAKRKEAEKARERYEKEQRRKGLVKYRERWIPRKEKEQLELGAVVEEVLDKKAMQSEVAEFLDAERSDAAKILFEKYTWQYRGTEHFVIYYQDANQGRAVADKAEYYYEKIAYDLNYDKKIHWDSRCKVFIIPDQDKWKEFLKEVKVDPDLVGGFINRDKYREIFLCSLSLPYLAVVFPHELTHLISEDFAQGQPIPLWLGEGLANYESGVIGYSNELLQRKLKAGEFISLNKLAQLENYPKGEEERKLFYAESEKLVEFLITQHGRNSFSNFFRLIVTGISFRESIYAVYRKWYPGLEALQKAWVAYIVK